MTDMEGGYSIIIIHDNEMKCIPGGGDFYGDEADRISIERGGILPYTHIMMNMIGKLWMILLLGLLAATRGAEARQIMPEERAGSGLELIEFYSPM